MAASPKKSPHQCSREPFPRSDQADPHWFETAFSEPSDRAALTQPGVHFEEVSEVLQVLHKAGGIHKEREPIKFASDNLIFL